MRAPKSSLKVPCVPANSPAARHGSLKPEMSFRSVWLSTPTKAPCSTSGMVCYDLPETPHIRSDEAGTLAVIPELRLRRTSSPVSNAMANTLVTRNQFNITPQGIEADRGRLHPGSRRSTFRHCPLGSAWQPAPQRQSLRVGGRSEDDARTVGGVRCRESGDVQDVIRGNLWPRPAVLSLHG